MTFEEATEELMGLGLTLAVIAEAMGVSHASVRQARLATSSPSYRRPPEGWETKLGQLALERGERFRRLGERLSRRADGKGNDA